MSCTVLPLSPGISSASSPYLHIQQNGEHRAYTVQTRILWHRRHWQVTKSDVLWKCFTWEEVPLADLCFVSLKITILISGSSCHRLKQWLPHCFAKHKAFICSLGQTALFRSGWCFIGVDPLLNSGHSPDVIILTQKWTKGEDVHSWHGRFCPVPLIFPSLSHYFHDTIWLSTLSLPTSPSPLKDLESAQLLVLIMFLLHPYRLRVQVRLRADLGERGRREAGREGGRRRLPLDILPGIWGYISQQTRLDMLATSGRPH